MLDLLADDVEADGLGEGPALADRDDVADADAEGGRAVGVHSSVALLETVVLLDEVEVVAADHDRVLHLGRDDDAPTQTIVSAPTSCCCCWCGVGYSGRAALVNY